MRVRSREVFVGFLLVLGLVVAACQPVQPVSEATTTARGEAVVESEAITDTATLTETESAESTAPVTTSETTTVTPIVTATVAISEAIQVSGTGGSPSSAPAVADPAVLAAGLAAYRAQYCGVCHTLGAAETRGTFGPPHDGMGATAAARLADATYQGAATTPAEYIHESIVEPQAFTVPGYATTSHRMPSYSFLDAESLDALVAFLLAQ